MIKIRNTKKEDCVYQDDTYQIFKKDAGALGDVAIQTAIDLIALGVKEMKEYGGGMVDSEDSRKLINLIKEDLDTVIKK